MNNIIEYTCEYPNCKDPAAYFVAGTCPGDLEPSQWCDEHYEFTKEEGWIRKFQGGLLNLPKDERSQRIYAW